MVVTASSILDIKMLPPKTSPGLPARGPSSATVSYHMHYTSDQLSGRGTSLLNLGRMLDS